MLSKKVVIFELKNCFYIQLLLSFSRFCTKIWQSKTEKGGHQNDVPTFFYCLVSNLSHQLFPSVDDVDMPFLGCSADTSAEVVHASVVEGFLQ